MRPCWTSAPNSFLDVWICECACAQACFRRPLNGRHASGVILQSSSTDTGIVQHKIWAVTLWVQDNRERGPEPRSLWSNWMTVPGLWVESEVTEDSELYGGDLWHIVFFHSGSDDQNKLPAHRKNSVNTYCWNLKKHPIICWPVSSSEVQKLGLSPSHMVSQHLSLL